MLTRRSPLIGAFYRPGPRGFAGRLRQRTPAGNGSGGHGAAGSIPVGPGARPGERRSALFSLALPASIKLS